MSGRKSLAGMPVMEESNMALLAATARMPFSIRSHCVLLTPICKPACSAVRSVDLRHFFKSFADFISNWYHHGLLNASKKVPSWPTIFIANAIKFPKTNCYEGERWSLALD